LNRIASRSGEKVIVMKGVVFDVRGDLAFFRRPDTTNTQLTYPFMTPTAIKGLVGAILGIEDFVTADRVGLSLLAPVRIVAQQLSMLGKDTSSSTFNRPTSIELVVSPAYRIYYAGTEFTEPLIEQLKNSKAVYHTYLGSAFALAKPVFVCEVEEVVPIRPDGEIETSTVVPTRFIESFVPEPGKNYSRAGGFMHRYLGNRTFERSIDYLYERFGRSIRFKPKREIDEEDGLICRFREEIVCLV
jgi:CRISPR-associated protein Cas5h